MTKSEGVRERTWRNKPRETSWKGRTDLVMEGRGMHGGHLGPRNGGAAPFPQPERVRVATPEFLLERGQNLTWFRVLRNLVLLPRGLLSHVQSQPVTGGPGPGKQSQPFVCGPSAPALTPIPGRDPASSQVSRERSRHAFLKHLVNARFWGREDEENLSPETD